MTIRYYHGTEWGMNPEWSSCFWEKCGLQIVKDGYNINTGQRLHVVESLPDNQSITTLYSALVVTEDYFNEHFTETP
jgi:hypothetical protein